MVAVKFAHISDFHVTADCSFRLKGEDPRENLVAVVDHLATVTKPDIVLVGGDVSHDGSDESYDFVRELFDPLDGPVVATPGNHDDPAKLTNLFPLRPTTAVAKTLKTAEATLLVVNSQIPGAEDGLLARLPIRAAEQAQGLVIMLLHHDLVQPDPGGRAGMRFPERELRRVLSVPASRLLLLTGHRHMAFDLCIGATRVLGAPATSTQFTFSDGTPERAAGSQPGYRMVTIGGGKILSSQILTVDRPLA
jgi:Icc protein